ncbi:hypothetical protein H072_2136 [Dactylellina haptotyla CBS 200.50]|uniref:Telomere-associated protein Rif1 N-terminal domain-containing protein n=1 Tax=Dactylellina haptotyla (strain CBS 200.50) TaxID=1284197 RepID=S8C896_DACHA|nr:hypothetical protein H072_2136 [Dactylellina haptotyla CBS 200.50]
MAEPTPSESHLPAASNMDVTMEDDDANSNILENLPARPPTPPKDTIKSTPTGDSVSPSPSPSDEAPASSAESSASPAQNRRVNFSPFINWHQPWNYNTSNVKYPPIKPVSLSSEKCQPAKSILKPFEKSIILITERMEGVDPDHPLANTSTPFGELLESVAQALASSERTKKSDTYAAFANTLRAYDGIPDLKQLANKMDLLLSFVKRDFNAMIPDVGTPDTTLIRQACKVLIIFVWWPETVGLISDEDANYFLNCAIDIVEQGTSKALSITYLYFLSQQKFSSRLMTNERVTKILQVAGALKDKQKGNSVDLERLSLYARLLVQAKGAMAQNAELWVDHVFQGMISTTGPMRTRAMTLALEVEKELGKERSVSKAVMKLFPTRKDGDQAEGAKKVNFIQKRLEKMLETKDEAVFVPQIWGVTISLLRGLTIPIDRWENFSPFLSVMSKCFNSSEQSLNIYAQMAWAKLIFASNINMDTTKKNFELLLRPIVGYIDESKGSRHTRQAKKAAIANIHTLLYYGFRPGAPAKQIEYFWQTLVEDLVAKYLLTSQNFIVDGCNILNGLFGGTAKWNETRVLEGTYITATELPRLEPKWIRANSPMIFKTLEVAVRTCLKIKDRGEIPHLTTWKKMMVNIAESAKKEIRISAEMMEFVANLLGFLKRLWTHGFAGKKLTPYEDGQFMTHFVILVQLAIQELGTACFTEKWLAEDGTESFSAISTPSGKFSSTSNNIVQHQPLWHLFRLFIDPFKGAKIGDNYARPISNVLSLCVDAQDSRRKKISLVVQGIAILPSHDISDIHSTAWSILATICDRVIPRKERDTSMPGGLLNGPEIRDILKILEWGYHHCGPEEFLYWKKLFHTIYNTIQNECGIAYIGPALVDPLAEMMRLPKIDLESTDAINYIATLASSLQYPTASVQYERVYKTLFGDQARKHIQIPYYSFYEVMGQAFRRTFDLSQVNLTEEGNTDILEFFDCIREAIEKLPKEAINQIVSGLQDGFALWLTCEAPADGNAVDMIEELLIAVCDGLQRTETFDSEALATFSHLISAGFESKSKKNVLTMLNFWNKTFGNQEALEYPLRVRKAISKLRRYADFKLPTFPDSIEDEINEPPPAFLETQTSDFAQHMLSSPPKSGSSPLFYRDIQIPVSSASKSSKNSSHPSRQSHAKLRHMDSQIEYQPVYADENDDPDAMESQIMTDRQKEVRDRQARDTDLFKDLNTANSSKRENTKKNSPASPLKLDLRMSNPMSDSSVQPPSSPAIERISLIENPVSSSPGLPPQPAGGKFASLIDRDVHFPTSDDLPSSPTSRINKSSFVPQLDDIPSSPPLVPVNNLVEEIPVPVIAIGDSDNLGTVDPRSVELSQGSKVRIEGGEAPPNLTTVVKNIPRSPREAVELQEYEPAEEPIAQETEATNHHTKAPSQVEDISIHLNSQMEEDIQLAVPASSTTGEAFNTAPENIQDHDDEAESVGSNVPDSPSSKVSSSRVDSPEPVALPSSQRRKGHKRKRSKAQANTQQDQDEEMLDCIVVAQEPTEVPPIPTANKEDQEIQQPPAKKAKAVSASSPAPTRQLRTRRSFFGRSASDTGSQEVTPTKEPPIQAKQQTPSKKEKKTTPAGSSSGVQLRSRGRPSTASYLSVPDSQSPRRGRSRRNSEVSITSVQDVREEVLVVISTESTPVKETPITVTKPIQEEDGIQVVIEEKKEQSDVRLSAALVDKLDSLFEEMKKTEFSPAELAHLDGTAFNIMHWVREHQHKRRASKS